MYIITTGIAAPKPGLDAKAQKKTILKHYLKGLLKGKLLAQKLKKSADKPLSQPSYSHSNTIYEIQLQKTIVLRMQPRRPATLTQPFQCDLQPQIFKKRIELRTQAQPLVAEHRGGTHRVRNDRSRIHRTHEVPFIAGCNHFTRKNARFRAPASSPKQSPGKIHAAITIRFAASRSKHESLYTHGNTRWQQSCSHSNATFNHRFSRNA